MKFLRNTFLFTGFILIAFILHSPAFAQTTDTVRKLSASEFANQIKLLPTGVIIDARTSREFESGHLKNAANYNVLAPEDFEQQIATLDKSKPVFIYCQSGKRSTVAAGKLQAQGFSQIYELSGGMKEWRESKFDESTGMASYMTRNQFENILDSNTNVLIEFYKPSCEPCKKMERNLSSVSKTKGKSVSIVRINIDENPGLVKEFFIGEVPVLHLYKNRKLTWANAGVAKKREIRMHLK